MNIVCPNCRDESRPVERKTPYFPFCSANCKERDLNNWVEERYSVEGKAENDDGLDGLFG